MSGHLEDVTTSHLTAFGFAEGECSGEEAQRIREKLDARLVALAWEYWENNERHLRVPEWVMRTAGVVMQAKADAERERARCRSG